MIPITNEWLGLFKAALIRERPDILADPRLDGTVIFRVEDQRPEVVVRKAAIIADAAMEMIVERRAAQIQHELAQVRAYRNGSPEAPDAE